MPRPVPGALARASCRGNGRKHRNCRANTHEVLRHTTTLKESWQGETWFNRKNGEPYSAWLVMNAVRNLNGTVTNFNAMSLDITERKSSEQSIGPLWCRSASLVILLRPDASPKQQLRKRSQCSAFNRMLNKSNIR